MKDLDYRIVWVMLTVLLLLMASVVLPFTHSSINKLNSDTDIIQEASFRGDNIDYVVINQRKIIADKDIIRILPSYDEIIHHTQTGNYTTIFYKNGYPDFVADYKE